MGKETKMSMVEILVTVFIFISLILVPIFLSSLLSKISVNIEDNALKRAATEIAENLLNSDLTENGAFLLDKLNALDKTNTEPVRHCYAYRVRISTFQNIDKKNVWEFGYLGNEDDFSMEQPSFISAKELVPAKFRLTVYNTNAVRCK